ncbi:MAG: hypothetical protein WA029_09185 [Anaerolineae bacterium]
MTTQSVTLRLPEPVFRYLQQIAIVTQRPIEQLVRQSVEGNLPPSVATLPPEIQGELLSLQTIPVEQLRYIALSQVSPGDQARHLELLDKNSRSELTVAEQKELAALRFSADLLTLRKAYAWAVLRWRGYAVPTLAELPLD